MTALPAQVREISLGNWLIIIGIAVSVAFQWRDFQRSGTDLQELVDRVQDIADNAKKDSEALDQRLRTAETKLERIDDRFTGVGERARQLDDRITTLDRGFGESVRLTSQQYGELLVRLARIECRLEPDCRPQVPGRR